MGNANGEPHRNLTLSFTSQFMQHLRLETQDLSRRRNGRKSKPTIKTNLETGTQNSFIQLLTLLETSATKQAMMESLWNLEQKWKLSTQEAVLLFVCTALAVVGLCTTAILNRKKKKNKRMRVDEELNPKPEPEPEQSDVERSHEIKAQWSDQSSVGWAGSIKTTLMSKVCWSGANKWEESKNGGSCTWRESVPPLLAVETMGYLQSHNKPVTPVWQRPILMGGKCELPRFSGLILYDEQGRSLRQSLEDERILHMEKPATVVTLRDLL